MEQQQQPEALAQAGPSAQPEQAGPSAQQKPNYAKHTMSSIGKQTTDREGIQNHSGSSTSKNGRTSHSKGKQVDHDSLTATEGPSKTKVSEIDDLANLLGHESSSLLSRRHTAIIVKHSELFGEVIAVNSKGCCKDLNELVTLLLEVLTRKETQILELKDRDHRRVERQKNLYWKCLQVADPIPADNTTDFATQNEEDSEPERAVSSPDTNEIPRPSDAIANQSRPRTFLIYSADNPWEGISVRGNIGEGVLNGSNGNKVVIDAKGPRGRRVFRI